MSMSAVFVEGLRRAATYVTLLFNLNAMQPATAEPASVHSPAVAPLAIDGSIAATGLTLVAHHVDARVDGTTASVQVVLLLRNDSATGISAQYVLPHPARLFRGDVHGAAGDVALLGRDTDLPPALAEQAETAAARPVRRYDVVVVAPGEQIALEVLREAAVDVRGNVQRLRLPLCVDPAAPWTPRFTADVLVEADRAVRRLSSPTHPVLVDGIGSRMAMLSVAEGRVHRQTQLVVEFELDTVSPTSSAPAAGRVNDRPIAAPR